MSTSTYLSHPLSFWSVNYLRQWVHQHIYRIHSPSGQHAISGNEYINISIASTLLLFSQLSPAMSTSTYLSHPLSFWSVNYLRQWVHQHIYRIHSPSGQSTISGNEYINISIASTLLLVSQLSPAMSTSTYLSHPLSFWSVNYLRQWVHQHIYRIHSPSGQSTISGNEYINISIASTLLLVNTLSPAVSALTQLSQPVSPSGLLLQHPHKQKQDGKNCIHLCHTHTHTCTHARTPPPPRGGVGWVGWRPKWAL